MPFQTDELYPVRVEQRVGGLSHRCRVSKQLKTFGAALALVSQLCPSENYVAATRRALLLLAVVPAWVLSAVLSLGFRPLEYVAAHLAVLALAGWIFAELSLIGFYKVPFTCSYLPGKVHVQVMLGVFLLLAFVFAMSSAEIEIPSFDEPVRYFCMTIVLGAAALGLWAFNRNRAKSAVLYFEELPPEVIITLGLISVRPQSRPNR